MKQYLIFTALITYFSALTFGIGVSSVFVFVPTLFLGLIGLRFLSAWEERGIFFSSVGLLLTLTVTIFVLQFLWVKLIGVGQVGFGSSLKISGTNITAAGFWYLASMASRTALFITVIAVISRHLKFSKEFKR